MKQFLTQWATPLFSGLKKLKGRFTRLIKMDMQEKTLLFSVNKIEFIYWLSMLLTLFLILFLGVLTPLVGKPIWYIIYTIVGVCGLTLTVEAFLWFKRLVSTIKQTIIALVIAIPSSGIAIILREPLLIR